MGEARAEPLPRTATLARVRGLAPPPLVLLVVLLAVWSVLAIDQPAYLLPGPVAVAERLWQIAVVTGEVWRALSLSLGALVAGAALALLVGAPLGIAMGANRRIEHMFAPYMNGLYVAPVSALTPLFVWWFGIGLEPRIATVFVFSAPIIALTCFRGARDTPRTYAEVARVFGATPLQIARKTIIPHATPYVVTAIRLGLGRAVKGTVLAELVVSITGLGLLLSGYSSVFDSASLIAVLLVLLTLGVLLQGVVGRIEVAIAPWRHTA